MDDKYIKIKAEEYVKKYREEQNVVGGIARKQTKYPMFVLLLGDDLEECSQKCKNTMDDLWMDADYVVFKGIQDINSADELIKAAVDEIAENDRSQSRLNLSIVIKTTSELSSKLSSVMETVNDKLRFSFGDNIDIYIYSIVEKSTTEDGAKKLKAHLDNIEALFDVYKNKNIYSIIVGDRYAGRMEAISRDVVHESIASCMVLLNNDTVGETFSKNDYFKIRTHTLIGFSQADIPLKTVYIIGFDTFSDTVINYYTQGHLELETLDFDIKKNILGGLEVKLNSLQGILSNGAVNLLCKKELASGNYSYKVLDAEFYGTLREYYLINRDNGKGIVFPTEDEIKQAFNKYLFETFIHFGLDTAKKFLIEIETAENQAQMQVQNSDYENAAYNYDPIAPSVAVSAIISKMVSHDIANYERICRGIVLDMIQKEETILDRISQKFQDVSRATEKCKVEESMKDVNVETAVQRQIYEDIIKNKATEIEKKIENGDLSFFADGEIECFEDSLFKIYDEKIVIQYLFSNMKTYKGDIESKENDEDFIQWISRQDERTELTMRLANTAESLKTIFLSDLTDDPQIASAKEIQMLANIKKKNISCVPVSGVPVFRVFKVRTDIKQAELFAIQQLRGV